MPIDFRELIRITLPELVNPTSGIPFTVSGIVYRLIPYVFGIAGFLILIFIILGGFQILTSQGDPKAVASGQQKITYAVVGFLIMFSAYWVVRLIAKILSLNRIFDIFGST